MPIRTSTTPVLRRRVQARSFLSSLVISAALLGSAFVIAGKFSAAQKTMAPAPVVAEFDTIKVPVPVDYVPAGKRVADIQFKTVAFPSHQLPEGALRSLETIHDAVTMAPLPANLPLFSKNFGLGSQVSNPVMERIPPGMRAMTIRVDATSAVEGWAGSGSVVDVLLITKDRTEVIAEKVTILSAERSVSPVEGAAAPNVPSTVTLLVTQEQCLGINTAIPMGRIAFALRGTRDGAGWGQASFTSANFQGGPAQSDRRTAAIGGYIEMKGDGEKKRFALKDNKWIKTEMVPDGFLPTQQRE